MGSSRCACARRLGCTFTIFATVALFGAAIGTIALAIWPAGRGGAAFGALSGAGGVLVYIAWLNRQGPEMVCKATSTSSPAHSRMESVDLAYRRSRVGYRRNHRILKISKVDGPTRKWLGFKAELETLFRESKLYALMFYYQDPLETLN
ncbi:hypothetical protein AXFE_25130 [Acidithrix ferrooxidans]|uniref:Uncharacterized protein n=1 Tax=Acidithrix ferrooxidans TaxID=1280514 RepID=A0A0D8HFA7_9ACTN|nr:hypothetical protein AXFE_25130 [Acidithrix ferrooxidans]